jgi:hypothetical protein
MKSLSDYKLLENVDTKTAVVAGVGAIVAIGLSYYLYKRVSEPDSIVEPAKLTGKIKLRNPQRDESRKEQILALKNAASGTKVIYFDCNDNMYTEDEIKDVKP